MMAHRVLPLFVFTAFALSAADKYTGPRPPKPDIPYLLHADRLVPTEVAEAHEENHKNEATYTIPGASSSARTPLEEPILIMDAQQIAPDRMELYKVDVRNGNREVTIGQKGRRGSSRPIHVLVTRLAGKLYRVEADDPLDNGQYCLSPDGSNRVFCFEIY